MTSEYRTGRMIPQDAQRAMSGHAGSTVVQVSASHAVYASQPAAVADLIKKAATAPDTAKQPAPTA
jgi:hypothetical protein